MTKLPMFSTTKLKTGWRFEDQFREQIENTFFRASNFNLLPASKAQKFDN